MRPIKHLLALGLLVFVGGALFVYLGAFNVAADKPHSMPFFKLMEAVRERSIAMRARGVAAPTLDDAALIASGAADYGEMCASCHLQPGVEDSELRKGMYPQPPNLTQVRRADPAQTFWIIKHGLKMSAMPAWGATHDDQRIWAMVAFLQQLPKLTPAQYQILGAGSGDESGAEGDEMKDVNKPNTQEPATHDRGGCAVRAVRSRTDKGVLICQL